MRSRRVVELVAVLSQLAAACHTANRFEHLDAGNRSTAIDAARPETRDASLDPLDATGNAPLAATSGRLLPEFLADAGNHWSRLIAADWELAAGRETYLCVRATVPDDVYLHEFASLSSVGTHHDVLLVDETPTEPDGVVPCDVDRSGRQIYDSNDFTAGSDGHLLLPNGSALQLSAGQQMLLNLHLLNSGNERLTGESGVLVRTLEQAQVQHLAQIILAGAQQLQVPPGSVVQHAECTWLQAATIFAVAPHMHELGARMKVVAHRARTDADAGAADTVLLDSLYSFDYQHIYLTEPTDVQVGDTIQIECGYQNNTQRTVGFGESAQDEMCFAALSVFPATDSAVMSCSE